MYASNGNRSASVIIDCKIDNLYYGKFLAVRDVSSHRQSQITAFIGPSGCGKSTALRCLNRMNDLIRTFRFEGHVHFRSGYLRGQSGSGCGAPLHRHGVSTTQPLFHECLQQRGLPGCG